MIRVGIETKPLANQSLYRGVGRYTGQLIESLSESNKIIVLQGRYPKIIKAVDIIHFPYFDFFFFSLPLFKKKKTVVTIHDCIPLVYPQYYPAGVKGKLVLFYQTMVLKNVDRVLTDSQNSKRDIVKYLGVPEKKIEVIYLAADLKFRRLSKEQCQPIKEEYQLKDNFILYVGDVNYNKNLKVLIKAFSCLDLENKELVLVGKAFENKSLPECRKLHEQISAFGINRRVKILGFVDDDKLVKLYNLAGVFCLPSLYEGFGLQVLEAMKCGCPVVASNVSSLPEIAQEGAVLVDPENYEEISKAIKMLINEKRYREKKIKEGFRQADKFSWQQVANNTIKIYEEVLAEK